MRLLLTRFASKPHLIIIFHLKTNRQKLEKHHVNGSQSRKCIFKKKGKKKVKFFFLTKPGLEPTTSGLEKTALLSTRLNTIIAITIFKQQLLKNII